MRILPQDGEYIISACNEISLLAKTRDNSQVQMGGVNRPLVLGVPLESGSPEPAFSRFSICLENCLRQKRTPDLVQVRSGTERLILNTWQTRITGNKPVPNKVRAIMVSPHMVPGETF